MTAAPSIVAALRALVEKANPAPWKSLELSENGHRAQFWTRIYFGPEAYSADMDHVRCQADAALTVAMRNALPELLDAVEKTDGLREAVEEWAEARRAEPIDVTRLARAEAAILTCRRTA